MSIVPPAAPASQAFSRDEGPPSYSGLYLRAEREQVLTDLGERGFTGWVGPQEESWVLAVAANPGGAVASEHRSLDDVGREAAEALGTAVLAVEVDREQRLQITAWSGAAERARYDSNPVDEGSPDVDSVVDKLDEPVVPTGGHAEEPDGGEQARALLETCAEGAGWAVTDADVTSLATLLDETLGESTHESERLRSVARTLRLPTWLIASESLPDDVPGGPAEHEVTELGRGKEGLTGRLAAALSEPLRKKGRERER